MKRIYLKGMTNYQGYLIYGKSIYSTTSAIREPFFPLPRVITIDTRARIETPFLDSEPRFVDLVGATVSMVARNCLLSQSGVVRTCA